MREAAAEDEIAPMTSAVAAVFGAGADGVEAEEGVEEGLQRGLQVRGYVGEEVGDGKGNCRSRACVCVCICSKIGRGRCIDVGWRCGIPVS